MDNPADSLVNRKLPEKVVLRGKINNLLQQQRCAGEQLEELMSRRDDLARELTDMNKRIQDLRDYQHQLFGKISECYRRLGALNERKMPDVYRKQVKNPITRA
ncbi:MAG: hypothetical protein ACFFD4_04020 [Candidatus Odinarchaeota archaeon]